MRTPRSNSRMSMSSRQGSRASDEDGKTAVKVGMWFSFQRIQPGYNVQRIPLHCPSQIQHQNLNCHRQKKKKKRSQDADWMQ